MAGLEVVKFSKRHLVYVLVVLAVAGIAAFVFFVNWQLDGAKKDLVAGSDESSAVVQQWNQALGNCHPVRAVDFKGVQDVDLGDYSLTPLLAEARVEKLAYTLINHGYDMADAPYAHEYALKDFFAVLNSHDARGRKALRLGWWISGLSQLQNDGLSGLELSGNQMPVGLAVWEEVGFVFRDIPVQVALAFGEVALLAVVDSALVQGLWSQDTAQTFLEGSLTALRAENKPYLDYAFVGGADEEIKYLAGAAMDTVNRSPGRATAEYMAHRVYSDVAFSLLNIIEADEKSLLAAVLKARGVSASDVDADDVPIDGYGLILWKMMGHGWGAQEIDKPVSVLSKVGFTECVIVGLHSQLQK